MFTPWLISVKILRVLATRKDIACADQSTASVSPKWRSPCDSTLINSERGTSFDREQYALG